MTLEHLVCQFLDSLRIAHVDAPCFDRQSAGVQRVFELGEAGFVDIGADHVHAETGCMSCEPPTDATAGTRDDTHLALPFTHRRSSFFQRLPATVATQSSSQA